MNAKTITLFSMIIILCSCLQSLHPFFTNDILITQDEITGKWLDASGNEWEFSKNAGQKNYSLIYKERGKETELTVNVFIINGKTFIDLYLKPGYLKNNNSLYDFTLVPVHLLVNIEITRDILKLNFINLDFIKEYVKTMKDKIKFEENGTIYGFILTDDSENIVMFLKTIKFDDGKLLFFKELKRIK